MSPLQLIEAKKRAISLIAEFSNNGNLISDSANADYLLRMSRLADACQKEIATVRKIPATYTFSQKPVPNQLGLLYAMETKQKLDIDLIEQAIGSKAYYFEVDNIATIYIEENAGGGWVTLETINNTTKRQYTAYKGLINAINPNSTIRIRFSGPYVYTTRNRALYPYTFPTAEDIPVYQRYVEYDVPVDFMELKKVMLTTDPIQYSTTNDYHWKNKRTVKANYFLSGEFEVHYYRYPSDINENTVDTYEFEVDKEAQELIPYYLAAHVSMDEPQKQNMVSTYLNMYQQKLANLEANSLQGASMIETTYTGW